jgi:cytochrome P450
MTIQYDPFSPAVREDPYPHYAALREEAPVHWAETTRAWVVSRHDDVSFVLKSPELFSSDAMQTMLITVPGPEAMNDPATVKQMLALAESLPFSIQDLMNSRNLISQDPPAHGVMRGLVNRGFTPRRIQGWEARAREIVEDCVAGLRRGGDFDVVHELAIPLPVTLIAEILGVEPEHMGDFKRWSDALISGVSGSGRDLDPFESGLLGALADLQRYIHGVVERREREPGDDLISVLVQAREGEAGLSTLDVVMFVILLLVAGNETTTNLIGNATCALLSHPDELARVHADRSLVPALVEEALRYESPIQLLFRRATRDLEIAGTPIAAGSVVIPLLASANRDERRWGADAGEFRIDRNPQGHLAFGFGNHFCLGASLARLEARLALDALVDLLPGRVRGPGELEYVDSYLVRGPARLELAAAPA